MTAANMTAIVVGGTGLVGRELVTQLAGAEYIKTVRSLTRRPIEYDNPKIQNHVIDFDHITPHQSLFTGQLMFSCLGTTKKSAGSVAAQRRVDFDYQFACAELARQQGVRHYLLVSSSGANRHSPLAYPKMKGELEHAVKQLGFDRLTILQPSLLLGERDERRVGEEFAALLLPTLTKLPGLRKARPISGSQVAKRLVLESKTTQPGERVLSLEQIFVE